MRDTNSVLLVVLLLMFGGVVYTQSPPDSTEQPAASAAAALTTVATPAPAAGSSATVAPDCGELDSLLVRAGAGTATTREFLIALVPDPLDAHAGWLFDAQLDAIQRAIEGDYFIDRYAIPWQVEGSKTGCDAAHSGCCAPAHQQAPGIVLFRSKDGKRMLVLFLVGETPTSGIHKAALRRALDDILEAGWKPPLRILGPTFDGSVHSLRLALQRWWSDDKAALATRSAAAPLLRIISGGVTNGESKQLLETALASDDGFGPLLTFQTTVASKTMMRAALEDYLEEIGVPPSEPIAVLTEGNTVYGRTVIGNVGQSAGREWLVINFPMHISHVRSEAERVRAATKKAPQTIEDGQRPALELSMQDSDQARDLVPALAPKLSSRTDEMLLANVLASIAREGISYVGLFATDVRDTLFLAGQVRKYCPDVRLFTFASDLLYTHPIHNHDLEGMIVVSTYPLLGDNQRWSRLLAKNRRRLQFGSDAAEGAYNATVALLAKDEREWQVLHQERQQLLQRGARTQLDEQAAARANELKEGESKLAKRLIDYAMPFADRSAVRQSRPPIWLSAVGRGGMWPLAVKPDKCPEGDKQCAADFVFAAPVPADEDGGAERSLSTELGYSGLWLFMLTLLCLFCAAHVAGWLKVRLWATPAAELSNPWQLFEIFQPAGGRPWAWRQRLFVIVCFTAQAAVVAVWGWPLVVLLGAWQWWPLSLAGEPSALILRYARVTNLAAGLSPLPPVLFLGALFYLWSVCNLRRLRLSQAHRAPNPLAGGDGLAGAGMATLEERVMRLIDHPITGIGRAMAVILLVASVLPASWLWLRFLPSFEGPLFDGLFGAAFVIGQLLVVWAFMRFLMLWHQTRRCLRRLAWHPMVDAYNRLPKRLATKLRGRFYAYLPTAVERELAVERWLQLVEQFKTVATGQRDDDMRLFGDGGDAAVVATRFAGELERSAACGTAVAAGGSDTQRGLSRAAQIATWLLNEFWRNGPLRKPARTPSSAAAAASTKAEDAFRRRQAAWLLVAEDFVVLQVVVFIGYVFSHLRMLVLFLMAGVLLMLATVSSYPFEPQRLLMVFTWVVILAFVLAVVVVVVQVDRNELLSRLSHTDVNQVTFDATFVGRIVTYAVVPILGLLAANFPGMGGLFGVLQPLLRIFR
ncbi:MAG: hypothetical protein HY699_18830 [Deltaproteobacteria bacterium]|nr:hypothetical protein [Deltaproteobacteria bacterium]